MMTIETDNNDDDDNNNNYYYYYNNNNQHATQKYAVICNDMETGCKLCGSAVVL